jgi:DNA-binding GntR family transcriptional regulator
MRSSPPRPVSRSVSKAITVKPKASRPLSSPDKVVAAISAGILARRFGPGHRLVEADLSSHYKVSRGTVREALKKLAAQGVVVLSPHRGASIRPLSRREAEHLLLVLEVLCGLAARLAAENVARGSARERMAAAVDALTCLDPESGAEQFMADRAIYYRVMLDIADNAELGRVMPLPQIALLRSQYHGFLQPKDVRDMRREYREIGDAILSGDAAQAERRMCKHLRRTRERLLMVDEDAFNSNFAAGR